MRRSIRGHNEPEVGISVSRARVYGVSAGNLKPNRNLTIDGVTMDSSGHPSSLLRLLGMMTRNVLLYNAGFSSLTTTSERLVGEVLDSALPRSGRLPCPRLLRDTFGHRGRAQAPRLVAEMATDYCFGWMTESSAWLQLAVHRSRLLDELVLSCTWNAKDTSHQHPAQQPIESCKARGPRHGGSPLWYPSHRSIAQRPTTKDKHQMTHRICYLGFVCLIVS